MAKTTTYNTVAGLNAALRRLPKEASAKLRDGAQDIADEIAREAAARAESVGGVAKYVAPTIKAKRDRVPVVKMGSSSVLPLEGDGWKRKSRRGQRQTVGDVIWGAEFGGGKRPTTRQFNRWRGNSTGAGYFLWPTVRDNNADILDTYSDALREALEAI